VKKPYVFFKKLSEKAKCPTKEDGNAGYDLFAAETVEIPPLERRLVKTDIGLEIPPGYYGHISDRSGVALKGGLHCLGKIVDETYRGNVGVILYNTNSDKSVVVVEGDRPAQIIFKKYENVNFILVDELSDSNRGELGFGSSGK
jgi:dUTP pyrophosphatase